MPLPDVTYFKQIADIEPLDPAVDRDKTRPAKGSRAIVKWLGGESDTGPWVYWVWQPAGAIVKPHKHFAPRIEYILSGSVEFFEADDAIAWIRDPDAVHGARHTAGSLSYVPAGRLYGYRMLDDSELLHVFFANPVGSTEFLQKEWADLSATGSAG